MGTGMHGLLSFCIRQAGSGRRSDSEEGSEHDIGMTTFHCHCVFSRQKNSEDRYLPVYAVTLYSPTSTCRLTFSEGRKMMTFVFRRLRGKGRRFVT